MFSDPINAMCGCSQCEYDELTFTSSPKNWWMVSKLKLNQHERFLYLKLKSCWSLKINCLNAFYKWIFCPDIVDSPFHSHLKIVTPFDGMENVWHYPSSWSVCFCLTTPTNCVSNSIYHFLCPKLLTMRYVWQSLVWRRFISPGAHLKWEGLTNWGSGIMLPKSSCKTH